MPKIIKYLEENKNNQNIDDFYFELTSLDEVFVKIGQMYKCENGGEDVDGEVSVQRTERSANKLETIENAHLKEIEFTSDDEIDTRFNGKQFKLSELTKEEIDAILSPPRQQPQFVKTIFYKLVHTDDIFSKGIIGLVLIPLILLFINYIISNVLIKSLLSTVYDNYDMQIQKLDKICEYCPTVKIFDLPMQQCQGFDSWGFQSICASIDVIQLRKYKSDVVWYGGNFSLWPNQTNLYSTQQTYEQIYYFDKNG